VGVTTSMHHNWRVSLRRTTYVHVSTGNYLP